jgi:hypothetical protein
MRIPLKIKMRDKLLLICTTYHNSHIWLMHSSIFNKMLQILDNLLYQPEKGPIRHNDVK